MTRTAIDFSAAFPSAAAVRAAGHEAVIGYPTPCLTSDDPLHNAGADVERLGDIARTLPA